VNVCFCCDTFSFSINKTRDLPGERFRNDLFCVEWDAKPQISHHTTLQPFYGFFSGTTRVIRCQQRSSGLYVQGKINRGRQTDHPAGCHSIWTNQCPPPTFPHKTLTQSISQNMAVANLGFGDVLADFETAEKNKRILQNLLSVSLL